MKLFGWIAKLSHSAVKKPFSADSVVLLLIVLGLPVLGLIISLFFVHLIQR